MKYQAEKTTKKDRTISVYFFITRLKFSNFLSFLLEVDSCIVFLLLIFYLPKSYRLG